MELSEILLGSSGASLIIMTLVQLAPIEINPWTALARAVGRSINREVIDKVDKLTKDVQTIRKEAAEQTAVNYRARILRFGDEVIHGTEHTKEHFDQVLHDITEYERYCLANPEFVNNMTALTSERIKKIFMECMEKNNFL